MFDQVYHTCYNNKNSEIFAMANNLSPSAREFLRGCHNNDLTVLKKYTQGPSFDVDIVFRGMLEAVRYKNWDAFFFVFDFASIKFKTHPRRFREMGEEVLWDIIAVSTHENSSEVSSVLKRVVPYCSSIKIANTIHAAAHKNKTEIFEQLLPKFVPSRITNETLFCISLENQNQAIQNLLFDRIDINQVWNMLQLAHKHEYNRNKNKTQSNVDHFEAMVFNKNLTTMLQQNPSEEMRTSRRKM